jgi:hypothetical protein
VWSCQFYNKTYKTTLLEQFYNKTYKTTLLEQFYNKTYKTTLLQCGLVCFVFHFIYISGDTPYPGIQSRDVPGKVKKGYKMKKPEYCDDT